MKKLVLKILVLWLVLNVQGVLVAQVNPIQTKIVSNVPELVKNAQKKMFPNTVVEKWFEIEKNLNSGKNEPKLYVAKFKNAEGNETYSKITDKGEVTKYWISLKGEKGLPLSVKTSINKTYAGSQITKVERIHYPQNNKIVYQVELQKNSTRTTSVIDEEGKVMREDKFISSRSVYQTNDAKESFIEPDSKESVNVMDEPEKNKNIKGFRFSE